MAKFAVKQILAKRPEAGALYEELRGEHGLEIRAAKDVAPAEMLIYDEIGFWGITAKDVVTALVSIGAGPLVVRVNSPGGDVFDGLAIYNALKQRGDVTIQIDGVAASAAAFIAMAGDTITMAETAMMMLHNCWTVAMGNRHDLLEQATLMEKIDGQQAGIFAQRCGKTAEEIGAILDAETWFTSTEAKAAGLVDSVMPPPAKKKAEAAPLLASDDMMRRLKLRLRLAEVA